VSKGRVVLFSNAPYFGGAEGYLVYLARGLRQRGWDPVGLVPAGASGRVLTRRLEEAGCPVAHFHHRPWTSLAGAWELLGKLRELRGEILHMNLPSPYEALRNTVALWARLAGYRRVVATEHMPMSLRGRRRVLLKVLLEPAIHRFIVMTRSGEEDLHRIHGVDPGRIVRIPYGIDAAPPVPEGFRDRLLESLGVEARVLVGHVGRLTARKGHRFLLEALGAERARLEAEGVQVLLVGDGEEEAALRCQAAELGLERRVHFLGHREDARQIIGILDLLVLPSLMETQPFVILEAMAAGVPVLSTRIYGIPDMVVSGETGLLVPPGDAEALRRALVALLSDPARRREMGRRALVRFRERFHLERMAEATERVYLGDGGGVG
jgi:glycosyltransferase involved in cell wall biosynthesis